MKKNIPRIYISQSLKVHEKILLSHFNHLHYIKKVLRMKIEEKLEIFNNTNSVFLSKITKIEKKIIELKILKKEVKNIESPLIIHLGQIISKSEKMNFSIQKSVELGVNSITPLCFENDNFNKKTRYSLKKNERWKNIAIAACQQCRRNIIPKINDLENIFSWCKKIDKKSTKIVFHPKSTLTINNLKKNIKNIFLLIGSERGFSSSEIKKIIQYEFIVLQLGPRILRAETAVIASITALQIKFGDLS